MKIYKPWMPWPAFRLIFELNFPIYPRKMTIPNKNCNNCNNHEMSIKSFLISAHISSTFLICSSLLFFSSINSDSGEPLWICSSNSLAISNISYCWRSVKNCSKLVFEKEKYLKLFGLLQLDMWLFVTIIFTKYFEKFWMLNFQFHFLLWSSITMSYDCYNTSQLHPERKFFYENFAPLFIKNEIHTFSQLLLEQ